MAPEFEKQKNLKRFSIIYKKPDGEIFVIQKLGPIDMGN